MNKVIFSMCIVAFGLFALAMPVTAVHEVYLLPQHCTATYGDELKVEIRVNATDFKSGEINLTYDSGCVNVTNYAGNVTNFPLSGWSHEDGSEWITFMTIQSALTGNYQIGTFTIQCVNEDACGTRLCFAEASMLYDPQGDELPTNWIDGTFDCNPQADENTHDGDGTQADDTTISSDENETEAPTLNETSINHTESTQTPPDTSQESDTSSAAAEPESTLVVQTPSSSSTQEQGSGLFELALALTALVVAGAILGILVIRRYRK